MIQIGEGIADALGGSWLALGRWWIGLGLFTVDRGAQREGERLFLLRASRVEGAEEFARFADVYEKKYGTRPRNENIDEIYLFRLGVR